MKDISPMEKFKNDNDYEIILETLRFKQSHHRSIMYSDPSQTQQRQNSIKLLIQAEKLLDPENPDTIKIAQLILRSYGNAI